MGLRVFAECYDDRRGGIPVLCDASDAHYRRLPPELYTAQLWVGDDTFLSRIGTSVESISLGDARTCRKEVLLEKIRTSNCGTSGQVFMGPIQRWNRAIGCKSRRRRLRGRDDSHIACVVDVASLTLKYPPLEISDLSGFRDIAVSNDGRTVAATDGQGVYLADMEAGTHRSVVPRKARNRLQSVLLILSSAILLAVGIWLFVRSRVRIPDERGQVPVDPEEAVRRNARNRRRREGEIILRSGNHLRWVCGHSLRRRGIRVVGGFVDLHVNQREDEDCKKWKLSVNKISGCS